MKNILSLILFFAIKGTYGQEFRVDIYKELVKLPEYGSSPFLNGAIEFTSNIPISKYFLLNLGSNIGTRKFGYKEQQLLSQPGQWPTRYYAHRYEFRETYFSALISPSIRFPIFKKTTVLFGPNIVSRVSYEKYAGYILSNVTQSVFYDWELDFGSRYKESGTTYFYLLYGLNISINTLVTDDLGLSFSIRRFNNPKYFAITGSTPYEVGIGISKKLLSFKKVNSNINKKRNVIY